MSYITVQEYADLKGISTRSVQRAISSGKLQSKTVPHPKRKDQVSFLVKVSDNGDTDLGMATPIDDTYGDMLLSPNGMASEKNGDKIDDNANFLATPDHHIADVSKMVESTPSISSTSSTPPDPVGQRSSHCTFTAEIAGSNPARVATSGMPVSHRQGSSGVSPEDSSTLEDYVPYHRTPEAQLFALLMEAIESRLSASEAKSVEWQAITRDYNSRSLVADLHRAKGDRSERALRLWFQKWQDSGNDMFALVHQNVNHTRGRKVTELEQHYLLAKLLNDSKPSVASAINDLKASAELGILESPSSVPTLKRWVKDWEKSHPAQWAQARKGSKYVKDNIAPSIIRDSSMLEVGDVLVADGHVLANNIINPQTGKPCRMTLVLFYDWASRYPLGASLCLTESSQHVLTAVRNAILHLGYLPRFIYFDNGKAFKSKLFHAKWEEHDLSLEFAGIFPRLGIKAEFAEAYNARSKVIERFFRTMQEQFERFQSAFRGRNIDDKPANLSRNEKWAQKMFTGKPLEYNEALDMVYYYFRHVYGMHPHSGIGNRKPYEVFAARSVDSARVLETERLNFLLLKAERKQLRSEGIWLNKCRYWDEAMINHVGNPVIIRYDYSDLRWILVYDQRGVPICKAALREAKHAFVHLSENPLAYQELKAELQKHNRLRRNIERSTEQLVKTSTRIVEAELSKHRQITEGIMEDIKDNNPAFRQDPIITPPEPKPDLNANIAELERLAQEEELRRRSESISSIPSTESTPSPLITLDSLLDTDESIPELPYTEVLKRIGIER